MRHYSSTELLAMREMELYHAVSGRREEHSDSSSNNNLDFFARSPGITRRVYAEMVHRVFGATAEFGLSRCTAHCSKSIVDRFLCRSSHAVSADELWLVMITALWIAAKVSEASAVPLDFIARQYKVSPQALIEREVVLGRALDWDLVSHCTPFHYVNAYCHRLADCVRQRQPHTAAASFSGKEMNALMHRVMFIVDAAVLDAASLRFTNSALACAALHRVVLDADNNSNNSGFNFGVAAHEVDLAVGGGGVGGDAVTRCLDLAFQLPAGVRDEYDYYFQRHRPHALEQFLRNEDAVEEEEEERASSLLLLHARRRHEQLRSPPLRPATSSTAPPPLLQQ